MNLIASILINTVSAPFYFQKMLKPQVLEVLQLNLSRLSYLKYKINPCSLNMATADLSMVAQVLNKISHLQ